MTSVYGIFNIHSKIESVQYAGISYRSVFSGIKANRDRNLGYMAQCRFTADTNSKIYEL